MFCMVGFSHRFVLISQPVKMQCFSFRCISLGLFSCLVELARLFFLHPDIVLVGVLSLNKFMFQSLKKKI